MKRKHFFLGALVMLLALVTTSCSRKPQGKFLELIPESTDVVFIGNLKTVMESAGGSLDKNQIKLPSFLQDKMNSSAGKELDKVNDFLKESGVNTEAIALAYNFGDKSPIILFSIDSKKKFVKAIEDLKFREKSDDNGTVVYEKMTYESSYDEDWNQYTYIAINGDYGYVIPETYKNDETNPVRTLERFIEKASDAPFSKLACAKYISSGNAGGLSVRIPSMALTGLKMAGLPSSITDIYRGIICMTGSLDKDEATASFKWFDENGKEKDFSKLGLPMNTKANIDPEALAYMGKDESWVSAVSMKDVDWNSFLNAIPKQSRIPQDVYDMVSKYLKKIDGTMAFGLGITNGLESFVKIERGKDVLNQLSFTVVVGTKKGEAKGVVKDLKNLAETLGIPVAGTANGFSVNIPGENAEIYLEASDNYLVLANHKVKKGNENPAVKALDFKKYISAMAFSVGKNHPLLRDLDIKNDFLITTTSDAKTFEVTVKAEIKGGKAEGFFAKIAEIVANAIDNQKAIEKLYDKYYDEVRGYSYDDDYMDSDLGCWSDEDALVLDTLALLEESFGDYEEYEPAEPDYLY